MAMYFKLPVLLLFNYENLEILVFPNGIGVGL